MVKLLCHVYSFLKTWKLSGKLMSFLVPFYINLEALEFFQSKISLVINLEALEFFQSKISLVTS